MTALERFAGSVLLLLALLLIAWLGVRHYGAGQYQAGHDAAIAAGLAELDRQAAAARKTESDLRAQLRDMDATAYRKEQKYAESLDAAQRRVRAGVDRLHCPTGPVPAAAPSGDRPAAAGPAVDGEGPDLMPEAAADVLGYGAAIAGLVRRYERLIERAEACREVTRN